MTEPHVPWLLQIAQAAVTWENLVREGVCGSVTVEKLSEAHMVQAHIVFFGWKRCPDLEFGFNPKIEYRVYSKKFDHGHRWLTLTAGVMCGCFCIVETLDRVP